MKKINQLLVLADLMLFMPGQTWAETRYAGADISLLPDYEKAGASYRDETGEKIADLIPFLAEAGMNAMRVRLFVDPDGYISSNPDADRNACQSLDYIIPLCRRIQDEGMSLMLDFHYSDTWADPGAQWTPAAWSSLSDTELIEKIGLYTSEVLCRLKSEGIEPQFIQPGNEISYGFLWGSEGSPDLKKVLPWDDTNRSRFAALLKSAIGACREACPDARIVIHSERTGHNDVLKDFFGKLNAMGVDYDIIGLSYYPYFHCPISGLDSTLTFLEHNFPQKNVMIVETGFPYKWEIPGTTQKVDYEYSLAGQNAFASDLVGTLEGHANVTGLFWWWAEYNAYATGLSGWYNAPLFDSTTGKATPALKTIASFSSSEAGVMRISEDDIHAGPAHRQYFTPEGIPAGTQIENLEPGLYLNQGSSILISR